MGAKCFKVNLAEFRRISAKCFIAKDFSGNEAMIPESQFYGYVNKTEESGLSVYLTEWIIKRTKIDHPAKGEYINGIPETEEEKTIKHVPQRLIPEIGVHADESLIR